MFVMDCYGHKLSNGVLFAHHLILDVPGGSSHLGYRRRVGISHNPGSRVKAGRLTDSEDNPQSESNKRRKIDTQERERAGARAPHRVRERVPATG